MKIALIGAGPRNLSILGRLLFSVNKTTKIEIDLFDPSPIGGRVWDPFLTNNHTFLMNTFANQVTLFDDYELYDNDVPIERPNLLDWAHTRAFDYLKDHPEYPKAYEDEVISLISANTFSSRGLFGIYAAWYFDELLAAKQENVTIRFHQSEVVDMTKGIRQFKIRTRNNFTGKYDRVILAPGHIDNQLNEKQESLRKFADKMGLIYYSASHPAENDFESITGEDNVLIEGLGLSFIDVLLSLTAGKGGSFITNKNGTLTYRPSGREPGIVAGSFNGLPPRSKGLNQKGAAQLYEPRFFTLKHLKDIAAMNGGKVPFEKFMDLLKQEMTYKFLYNQVKQSDLPFDSKKKTVLRALENPYNWSSLNERFDLNLETNIDWQGKIFPALSWKDLNTFNHSLIPHIENDIQSAQLGNDWSPLTGAYDLLRDMRDIVRTLYNENYFDEDGYEKMLTEFRQFDNQLSAGPPLVRMRQLLALLKAGVITIAGPGFKTGFNDHSFEAIDSFGQHFEGSVLIEARLSTIDFRIAKSPLIRSLARQGLIEENDSYYKEDGTPLFGNTIKVDLNTFTVINRKNQPVEGFYISGIPLEGERWFNTVIPRPYVNSLIFQESQRIVDSLLSRSPQLDRILKKKD